MWFDSHCHFSHMDDKVAEIVDGAVKAGVSSLMNIACDAKDWQPAIEVAERFENVWLAAGVHPNRADAGLSNLKEIVESDQVLAVGECGLDYYYEGADRKVQQQLFSEQIQLAHQTGLALVIHSRSAWDDTFSVLDEQGAPERTVFHCFTGGVAEAKKCLDRGTFVSFSGIVTFPSAAGDVAEAAKYVPDDRIVIETDSPYLAPVPLRGKPNAPANVAVVGEFVAGLRGLEPQEFADLTSNNTKRLFSISEI